MMSFSPTINQSIFFLIHFTSFLMNAVFFLSDESSFLRSDSSGLPSAAAAAALAERSSDFQAFLRFTSSM